MSRNYNDELQFLDKINKNCWRIKKGFVPNMQVSGGSGLRNCRPRLHREPVSSAQRRAGRPLQGSTSPSPALTHRLHARDPHTRTVAAGGSRVFSPRAIRQDVFLVFRDFCELFQVGTANLKLFLSSHGSYLEKVYRWHSPNLTSF